MSASKNSTFSTSPKGVSGTSKPGTNQLSSSELLSLLRQPPSVKEPARSKPQTPLPSDNYAGLEQEFSKLYLGQGGGGAGLNSSVDSRLLPQLSPKNADSITTDNYGMTGLADSVSNALLRRSNPVNFGLDVRSLGIRLDQSEPLSRSFISPWFDPTTSLSSGGLTSAYLDSVLPSCYNVQPSPAVTGKIPGFVDETLFYMFYAMPGDRMQELAARELFSRNWRYHKELKIWILMVDESNTTALHNQMISPDMSNISGKAKSTNSNASALAMPSGNPRPYTVFDPQIWAKVTKELPIRAEQLEDRFGPSVSSKSSSSTSAPAPAATPILFNVNRTT